MNTGEPIPGAAPAEVVKPIEKIAAGIGAPTLDESKVNIEHIKKDLIVPRTISKKTDQEGEAETASQ